MIPARLSFVLKATLIQFSILFFKNTNSNMPRTSKAKSNHARVSKIPSCYLSPHERLLAHATLHCFPVVSFKLTITEAAPVVKEKNRMKMPKKHTLIMHLTYSISEQMMDKGKFLIIFCSALLVCMYKIVFKRLSLFFQTCTQCTCALAINESRPNITIPDKNGNGYRFSFSCTINI